MKFRKFGDTYLLRLEIGDEILSQLKLFCSELQVGAAKVSGIGVVGQAVISYFDLPSGEYLHRELSGNMEMTSLLGNISLVDGEPFPHLHVTLAGQNFHLLGGHLSSGVIGVTGELFVETYPGILERKVNQENGLNLLVIE